MDAATDTTQSYASTRATRKLPKRSMVLIPLAGFIVSALVIQAAPLLDFFCVFVIALALIIPLLCLIAGVVAFLVACPTRRLVRKTLTMIFLSLAVLVGVAFSTWTFFAQQLGNERRGEV